MPGSIREPTDIGVPGCTNGGWVEERWMLWRRSGRDSVTSGDGTGPDTSTGSVTGWRPGAGHFDGLSDRAATGDGGSQPRIRLSTVEPPPTRMRAMIVTQAITRMRRLRRSPRSP